MEIRYNTCERVVEREEKDGGTVKRKFRIKRQGSNGFNSNIVCVRGIRREMEGRDRLNKILRKEGQ